MGLRFCELIKTRGCQPMQLKIYDDEAKNIKNDQTFTAKIADVGD